MKWGVALVALGCCGCARFPDNPIAGSTRLVFTLRVESNLRTGSETGGTGIPYIYMVALRFSDLDVPIDDGPIPIIAPPWGNGFIAGRATHFVWWDPTAASEYLIYRFQDPAALDAWFPVGVPIVTRPISVGGNELRFEIELAQLFPSQVERDALRSVQVNFLSMDRIPQTGTDKAWDALGDSTNLSSLNTTVRIPLRSSQVFNNQRSGFIEPQNDQANPELDIVDWSVEVQLQ